MTAVVDFVCFVDANLPVRCSRLRSELICPHFWILAKGFPMRFLFVFFHRSFLAIFQGQHFVKSRNRLDIRIVKPGVRSV